MSFFIYGNNCSVDTNCEPKYSLYFPCISTITRGENVCLDFYIIDNYTKEEIDLREVDDITLNISGRYNCNLGSFSYPDNIKSLQVEKFSKNVYDIYFLNIINYVKLYIDIVDDKHNVIESFLFNEKLSLDIAIEGSVGYFVNNYNKYNVLNLKGFDTKSYMFLGWNIEENDEECNVENIYDYLIKNNNLIYNINEDCIIRAVYQKRKEYTIQMAKDNYNSSFVIDYMGKQYVINENDSVVVLEGHDVKVSCIPNNIKPYKFVKWKDGYNNPYRIFNISGDNLDIFLKAYCTLNNNNVEYIDNIDVSTLNNFFNIYPSINKKFFVDSYIFDNIYINKCEIDVLNDIPYIKIIEDGYIQILNITEKGNYKLFVNNLGGNCKLFVDNYEVFPSITEKNIFLFEFDGTTITLTGNDSCVFSLELSKEVILDKGKCMLCFNSEDTLNFHPGELVADGGIIVNDNPYGISPIKIAKVTDVTPLIIKK